MEVLEDLPGVVCPSLSGRQRFAVDKLKIERATVRRERHPCWGDRLAPRCPALRPRSPTDLDRERRDADRWVEVRFEGARETTRAIDFSYQERTFGSLLGSLPTKRAKTNGLVIYKGYVVAEFGGNAFYGGARAEAVSLVVPEDVTLSRIEARAAAL